ncbi:alginate lyase family protein, partial [Roseivivax isoporae]|uniref:Alginate lyase domain-containing protein n=1 Tax=Roseivivax isoporae LMG 25204 TaxID=1449351 RepID=X7F451_9RHOB
MKLFPSLPLALAMLAGTPSLASAQDDAAQGCIDVPEPVVSLSYGSRYTDESEDRSDLDADSNAAVNEALGPIDDFIQDLASKANAAARGDRDAAACVVDAVLAWADADALSELETMNAQISSPARIAGIAMAYLQVRQTAEVDPDAAETIEGWLDARARAAADYFDRDAPPGSSRNNLRAWAGLAAASAGEATGNDYLKSWAAHTTAVIACQADEDGALPLEMDRGPRALHYQLHAVAPLVVSAALLDDDGYDLFETCDGGIHRVVGFIPRAFENPDLVTEKAGEAQTYFSGDDELAAFELAWADAYLSLFEAPEIAAFVEEFRPLGNSKLGGSQDAIW